MASAAHTPVASAMARQACPPRTRSAVSAPASTHSVIMPATSISMLAYWAPPKNSGSVASTSTQSVADAASRWRRTNRYSATALAQAASAEGRRAAHSLTPNRRNDSSASQ
ncbi:Uncharacterised protein [Bordetella pertussis]|nr:Uncharacterised protein [Bordetella pertussis]CFP54544.1 Uncharacterised protein [Bordetella pertussis]CPJ37350.1 Uncharacterised protein [Bordetella pertussis]CPK82735.1 Uncharacterised protein [Bordetella pertussis]CPO27310.1 Uncharacterised protein [Bordetella pertussis]